MKNNKNNNFTLRLISIFIMVSAFITIIPYTGSSEASILGYRAICPFTPISTVIVFYVGITVHRYLSEKNKQI